MRIPLFNNIFAFVFSEFQFIPALILFCKDSFLLNKPFDSIIFNVNL